MESFFGENASGFNEIKTDDEIKGIGNISAFTLFGLELTAYIEQNGGLY